VAPAGEPTHDQHSPDIPDIRLGAEPLTFEQVIGPVTPLHFRRMLDDAEATTDTTERQLVLSLAAESLEDIAAEGELAPAILADLRAELFLGRALLSLSQHALAKARSVLQEALRCAEEGSGDVLIVGRVQEGVAQLALLVDGPVEAELELRPAIDLFLDAEQQPELASALFRSAVWRLEAGERELGLEQVRAALESLELETLLEDERAGVWAALERCVGTSERVAGVWAPLHFAVETELAAVALAEPLRRRVQGEAWAMAALATLERAGDVASAGRMLVRAERCLLRDETVSVERLGALARALHYLACESEQLEPIADELGRVGAVLTAWSERALPPASLWSRAVTEGDPNVAVFASAEPAGE
jgi:hypothetical protein